MTKPCNYTCWLLILILESIPATTLCQCYFHKVYDYDGLDNFGFAITESYEGFVSAGESSVLPIGDGTHVVSVNACGDTLWTKIYTLSPGLGGEVPGTIFPLRDSSYLLFGWHRDTAEAAVSSFLFKISNLGDSVYFKNVNVGYNDFGQKALRTSDGGYAGAGYFNIQAPDGLAFLVKTDSLGNIQWQNSYGSPYFNLLNSLDKTHDGGYLLSGSSSNPANQSYDLFLVKTDSLGNQEWRKMYGNSKWEDWGHGIATHDGGYILAGSREIIIDDDYRGYIVKTDSAGEVEWERLYGDPLIPTVFRMIVQLDDGNYLAAGSLADTTTAKKNARYVHLLKLNPQGDIVWERKHTYSGGKSKNYIEDLKVTSSGDFIMTGYIIYSGLPVANDMFILKTDSCGYSERDTTQAQFSITRINGPAVTIVNESQTYCSSYWLFGDGESSLLHQPSHTYQDTGTYTITLITRAGNTTDTFQQEVTITSLVGVQEANSRQPSLKLYPNPASSTLHIEVTEPPFYLQSVRLLSITGQEIRAIHPHPNTQTATLNTQYLPSGFYFCHITFNNGTSIVKKVAIE